MISAGGFWAARAHLVAGDPEQVTRWLGIAAGYPRTFYGLIAKHILGLDVAFDWSPPPLTREDVALLVAVPGARRALALLQVGLVDRGEHELRNLYGDASPRLKRAILGLAVRAQMPGLAMRLGNLLAREGDGQYDSAAYPLPHWQPARGFTVDRALVYAIMRQESGFNPRAKSHAGARGLMQLMPRTASFVARDRSLRRGRGRRALYDPQTNLALGQKYIAILAAEPGIDGNLFKMVAAWNGGPGNVSKWLRITKHRDDPLLFIEGIPSRETRIFLERVLTNLWVYRHRLGQPTPSLAAIAAGDWPVYTALDRQTVRIAHNVEDRR
jgi:soluble lytic murein transglycosylase-like protein